MNPMLKRGSLKRTAIKRTAFPRNAAPLPSPGAGTPNASNGVRNAKPTAIGLKRGRIKAKANPKLQAWSRAVRERDGNGCQIARFAGMGAYPITGVECDGPVDPHHIAPRGRRRDLKYVVANGTCLCRRHHDRVHDNPIEAERIGLLSSETREKAMKASTGD
jgi:hypothetical protein